ncbi:hypothetical protein [Nonomuraea turcica]|uniref:hypothetical protein n=1 Tax=Nonomuraea sp. G32 TaxID=3067274 RepID=UPI00273B5AA5|nr:hypothetical protein [Nonomuraea sp. G32]MDP4502019.1 hypothetical protein [Nonomuraea sp. G32]
MRTGVWLIGARGSVAVTSMLGALAVRAGLAEPTGCVLESPELHSDALPGIGDLVFGGHGTKASSEPACAWSSPGTAATRLWPRRWSWTWRG